MKVLLLNGSPHRQGNTATALTEVAKQLEAEGIESEMVWIGNSPVRGCIACRQCTTKGLGRCIFDDDVCNRISEKFAEADGLIVGSPVYYGQPNGALLSIIQRAFFSNSANIAGKPAAAIAVCRRGGATATFEALNMPFQMLNMQRWIERVCRRCAPLPAIWLGYSVAQVANPPPAAPPTRVGI